MQFADDPAAWLGHDGAAAHRLDPVERERLQQAALGHRLQHLLPRIAPLRLLAELQGLDAGVALDRAPLLCLPHTVYKSYDPHWLEALDFARMGVWAGALLGRDLAVPEGTAFASIDAWLDWLEAAHGLEATHSTGTTGRMSLVLRDRVDARAGMARMRLLRDDWQRAHGLSGGEEDMAVIHPGSARGRTALHRFTAYWHELPLPPAQLAFLHEQDLGADYELYVVAARTAQARGADGLPAPSAHVEARLAQAEVRFHDREAAMARLVDRIDATLGGRRAMVLGGTLSIHALARAALARGIEGRLWAGSFAFSLGGLKGHAAPAGMEQTIARFVGSGLTMTGYGMTELNEGFISCEAGYTHVPPWMVVWVLDPAGGWQPKPRAGVQEGRAAFVDLATRGSWSGVVTADHVSVNYGVCACGRLSPAIGPLIRRIADADEACSFLPCGDEVYGQVSRLLGEAAEGGAGGH